MPASDYETEMLAFGVEEQEHTEVSTPSPGEDLIDGAPAEEGLHHPSGEA